MSLSLLVPEEKKFPISINFQKKRLSPVYMSIQLYCGKTIKDRGLSFGMVPTKGKNCKVSSLNSLWKLVFQIPDFQSLHNRV